jgi:hypothetical protein
VMRVTAVRISKPQACPHEKFTDSSCTERFELYQ